MKDESLNIDEWLGGWMASHDIHLWGVADVSRFSIYMGADQNIYPSAVSWAIPIPPEIMVGVRNGPTRSYAWIYAETNSHINTIAQSLAEAIRQQGYLGHPVAASDRTDTVNIRGDFPHKTAATLAGLGWIGRHCQLVTRQYGPWVRLGTVFTDMPLRHGTPKGRGFCGKCRICVDACPAGALRGNMWFPGIDRAEILDVVACDQWKKTHYYEFHKGHNCGICSAVCPYGVKHFKKSTQ